MARQNKDDLYTYRSIRAIAIKQRAFWLRNELTSADPYQARKDRIMRMLGARRKYARSLTNGRYDEYGCIVRSR
jgi:hypothetical protein